METITYFTVKCSYCGEVIPLAEYKPTSYYKLADSFQARHKCGGLSLYSFGDLYKMDLASVYGLMPNLGFAQEILPY